MTCQAGNSWFWSLIRLKQPPGTLDADWSDQVFDRPFVKHSVTTKAVGIQLFSLVVAHVQKDVRIARGMTATCPIRKLSFVTAPATIDHVDDLGFAQPHLIMAGLGEVVYHSAPILPEAMKTVAQSRSVTTVTFDVSMRGSHPEIMGSLNLMTTRAGSSGSGEMPVGAGRENYRKDNQRCKQYRFLDQTCFHKVSLRQVVVAAVTIGKRFLSTRS
jgi:hypothetical protein